MVAAFARRPTADDGDRRGVRRRGAQRSPSTAHRAPPGELGRLGLFGQRRATLPQGRQPAADEQRLRRRPPDRDARRHRVGGRPRPRRAARPRPRRPPPHLRRRRRTRHPAAAGLPAAVAVRPIGPLAGGRAGAGARRLARAPSVDRVVVGPRRPDAQLDAAATRDAGAERRDGGRSRAAFVRRAAAADVEQVDPRPLGEAIVRASRPDPCDRRPLRRRAAPARSSTAPTATSRSAGARRGGRPRRLRQAPAEHGALRQRVRRRFGAVDASVHRRRTGRRASGRTSTGSGSPTPTATTSTRSSGSSRRVRSPRSTSGGTRRSTTNRTSSRCRSRRCAR